LSFFTRDNAGALAERFYIQGTGNAWLAGTLTQASDARLKKNIKILSPTLNNLSQLHGYTYDWINEQKDNEQQIGLLAQEVQKIYPQLVKQNSSGELSVNYSGLVPVLLEGIKEQQKQIDELKLLVQKLLTK
jgi:trimeric autotransporter adhesin